MIGYAESDTHSYIVRMVVNQYTSEVDKVDVLYAINTKKEPAGKMPGSHGKTALPTGSTISIFDLLDLVNKYFPDVLPEDVLKHYEYDARPEGDLSGDILYQPRPDFEDIIFDDFDGEVTDNDARLMAEYLQQGKTDIINHLINNTRSIEIPDGKIRTIVNRLIRSYDLSTDSNKDIYVAVMSLLESNNKTKVNGRGDIHLIFIKSYLVIPS